MLVFLAGCRPAPDVALAMPQRPVSPLPGQAQALYDRWAAALDGLAGSVTLSATESELTALAANYLGGTPVTELTLWCEPDRLVASASVLQYGAHTLGGSLQLIAQEGRPQVTLQVVTLDGHPLPRWVQRSLQHAVNSALTDATLPLRLEQVTLREGAITLQVSSR